MKKSKQISNLIEKYFDEIKIEEIGFEPDYGAVSDAAYMIINIPKKMIEGYQKLKEKNVSALDFWKGTNLRKKLRRLNKFEDSTSVNDILDFLDGKILAEFRQSSGERIRMYITEIPEYNGH